MSSTATLLVDIIGSKELAAQPGGHFTIQSLCQGMQTFLDTKFKALAHNQEFKITLEPAKGDDIRYRIEGASLRIIADFSLSAVIAALNSSTFGRRFRYVVYRVESDKPYQPLIGAFDGITKTPEGKRHHIAVERSIQSALSDPKVIEWLKGAAHIPYILPFKGESATGVHVDLYCPVVEPAAELFSVDEVSGRENRVNEAPVLVENRAEDEHKNNGKYLTTLPYVGLNRVRLERHEYFGGRDYEIDELIGRVKRGQRFLVIYGISGVGKSSLLAAGLMGRLIYKDAIPEASRHWQYLFVRPKGEPFGQLASKIIDKYGSLFLYDSDHLAQLLKKSPAAFQDIASTILAGKPDAAELVVAVDQMEELFTRAATDQKKREAVAFLQMLVRASETLPVRVLGTIRDDYFRELSSYDFLIDQLNKEGIYCLKPLDATGLSQAIFKPLEHAKWSIEHGLVRRIVEDAGVNPGALPLVALCMERLQSMAKERGESHISNSDYDALGGLQGIIRVLVHEIYEEMGEEAKEDLFHRLFFHLVQLDNGKEVRRQISSSALRGDPVLEKLVEELINKRLLTGGEENAIEISHDRLFEIWDLLREWIEKHRELLTKLRDVEERLAKYKAALVSKADEDETDSEIALDETDQVVAAEQSCLTDKDSIKEIRALLDVHGTYISNREEINLFLDGSEELIDRTDLAKTILNGTAFEISQLLKKNIKLEAADARAGRIDSVFYAAITGDDKIELPKQDREKQSSKRDLRVLSDSILNSENIRITTKETFTPLHLAAISGRKKIARKILHLGMEPDIKTRKGLTPLMLALAFEQGDEVASLLLAYGADAKHKSHTKNRPILSAAYGGKLGLLKDIRKFDEDLLSPEDEQGWTALTWAAQCGHGEVAQYLIEQGADVRVKTKELYTPLIIAAAHGHWNVIEILLEHGVDASEEVGPNGDSALMTAAEYGHADATVKLAQISKLDAQDARGMTAIMHVVNGATIEVEKKFEICKILVEAGADVSVLDNGGQTAVNHAQWKGYTALADWLKSQLPPTWHLDAGNLRREELRGRLNRAIAWPVPPYIHAKWTEMREPKALDVLYSAAEIELAEDKAPFALVHSIRRLRSASLSCLPGWHIYEALVEVRAQNTLAILTFLMNDVEVKRLDRGERVVEQLWERKAIDLSSTRAVKDYARLFCAYVQNSRVFRRLIEDPKQLSWERDESDLSCAFPLPASRLRAELDSVNKHIIVRGAFLEGKDLLKGRMTIPASAGAETLFLRNRLPSFEMEKIASSLPVRDESFWNGLRLVGDSLDYGQTSEKTMAEAAHEGDMAVVERLIAQGRVNEGNFRREAALITAALGGHLEVVRRLLEAGADVNARSYNEQTALHVAANKGDGEIVRLLLTHSSPAKANPHDDEGRTPLMLAAEASQTEVVRILLDNGGQAEREDNRGRTALFYAVEAGDDEIVNLLIPMSNVQHESDEGETPLGVCIDSKTEKRSAIFDALIASGAAPANVLHYVPAFLPALDEATAKVIGRAMERYGDTRIDFAWPSLPKLHEDWRLVPKKAAAEIASRLDKWQIATDAARTFDKYLVLAMRSVETPFYPDWKLFEIMLQPMYHQRKMVVSCLMANGEERDPSKEEAARIVLLDGSSPPVHELNGRLPINLENELAVIAYLRFFCGYIWGEEGGFWIIDDSESLPWIGEAGGDARIIADKVILSPELLESGEKGHKIRATVLYARHLFEVHFLVAQTGMIKMPDDTRKTRAELPLLVDGRNGIYRIVKSAHGQ